MACPPAARSGPGGQGALGQRLLESARESPGGAGGGRAWLQRGAAWRGPDPTVALALVLALAGAACLAEQRLRRAEGRPTELAVAPAAADLAATAAASAAAAAGLSAGGSLDPEFAAGSGGQPGPISAALLAILLGSIFCQYLSEQLAVRAVMGALQGMEQLGLRLAAGSVRSWVFLGRLSVRNCVAQNPEGYGGDCLLLVRGATAHLDVWRLVRSLGSNLDVQKLCLEDVDVFLEEGGHAAYGRPNVETILEALSSQQREQPRTRHRLRVGQVVIKNVGVQARGVRTPVADAEYSDFSAASGAESASGAIAALVAAIARGALAASGTAKGDDASRTSL